MLLLLMVCSFILAYYHLPLSLTHNINHKHCIKSCKPLLFILIIFFCFIGDQARSIHDVHRVFEGKNITLNCDSTIQPKWFFETLPYNLPDHRPVSNDTSLQIFNVQLKHTGYYYCYGSSDNGATHFLKRKDVIVFLSKCTIQLYSLSLTYKQMRFILMQMKLQLL